MSSTAVATRLYVDTTTTSHDDIDHIAVERVINDTGPRPHLTAAEREFAARFLADHGFEIPAIAERLGVKPDTVRKLLGLPIEPRSPREPAPCGTRRGYHRHRRSGDPACPPCRAANAAADRRLRTAGTTVEPTTKEL